MTLNLAEIDFAPLIACLKKYIVSKHLYLNQWNTQAVLLEHPELIDYQVSSAVIALLEIDSWKIEFIESNEPLPEWKERI